jgi:hypothetical protein
MICNILSLTILLLIIIIVGLISFSQKKTNELETFLINPNPTEVDILTRQSTQIMTNNNIINSLLNELQTTTPTIKLVNYDPNNVYQDYKNNITSNINSITSQLSSLYKSGTTKNNTNITNLENSVSDLENLVYNLGLSNVNDKVYNSIKSLNNGMEMKLVSTPNTIFTDSKTGSNIAGYMVMVNNGCLSVGATDYDIYKCNDKNPKQIFKMEHILNETAYQNNIDSALPIDNTNKANINYPFVMMKSINNENCLTNNHGNLTVQPCYSFTAQRWFPL